MMNLAGPFGFAPANHSLQELKSEGGPAEGGPGTSRKPESIRPVGIAAYARLDICSELQLIDYSYPSKYLARPPPAVVLLPDVAMAGTFANAKGGADCHVAGLKMTYFEAMVLPSRVGGGKDLPGGLSTGEPFCCPTARIVSRNAVPLSLVNRQAVSDATDDAHATGSDAEYWGEKNGDTCHVAGKQALF